MPGTTERQIAVTPPARQSAGLGFLYVLFGIALAAVGVAVLLAVLKYVGATPLDAPVRKKTAFPIGICVLFMMIGLSLFLLGVTRIVYRLRRAHLASDHPHEPWFTDFDWSPAGWRERPVASIVGFLLALFFPCLLAVPFNYWAFGIGAHGALVALVVLVDLALLAGFAWVALRLARKLRYGGSFIRYERFPFFLGERLDVRVGSSKFPPAGVPLTATLRFIEERLGQYGFRSRNTYHQLYADERTVDAAVSSRDEGMSVSLPLPVGDYETALSATYIRFWQLHLHASASGVDFDENFLVPVYRRPGNSSSAGR